MKITRLTPLRKLWPLAVLAIGLTGCASSAAQTTNNASQLKTVVGPGCHSLSYTEKAVRTEYHDVSPPGPSLRDSGVYHDVLFDANGKRIGTALGYAWITYQRPSDSHLLAYYREDVQLANGTVRDAAVIDLTGMSQRQWVTFPTAGTSGHYLGLFGFRKWKVLNPAERTVSVQMVMCTQPPKLP